MKSYRLDKNKIRIAFDRAAPRYDEIAILQHEVGTRLAERLDFIRLEPKTVIDVGAGTGRLTEALADRYPDATLIALDLAPTMLQIARRRLPEQRFVCGDAEQLPFDDQSADLVISSLTLQWCNDLEQAFNECRRILKPGGLLMFTSFGPDTLKELRSAWSHADKLNHVNAFFDMRDIGDALLRAQWQDPVTDVEHFTLTYPTVIQLMRELKAIGAHNVMAGRARGLTGKSTLKKMEAAYEAERSKGVLPATYEVIYGHAWVPTGDEPAVEKSGEFKFPIDQLGRL